MDRFATTFGIVLLSLLLVPAPASADGLRHSPASRDCDIETDYALHVRASGLRLEADDDADDGLPDTIEIADGVLRVDGKALAVSDADAARLRRIESGTRALLPDIGAISREAIAITFDALGGVNAALGNRRQARDFEALRERTVARLDGMLARGEWSSDAFGDDFEAEIEAAAEAMAASFTPMRAIWMVVSGGVGRMERRMEKMEAELERSLVAREATLQRHALALCDRLEAIQLQQDGMELRLDDGRPLRVFEVRREGTATALR